MSNQKASQSFTGEYRLAVENFGPIAQASVALRPLTVFIGPSNTGKSYFSILIYALHQCFGGEDVPPYGMRWTADMEWMLTPSFLGAFLGAELASPVLEKLRDWLSKQPETITQPSLLEEVTDPRSWPSDPEEVTAPQSQPPLPEEVTSYIRSVLERPTDYEDYLEREIRRCFGVDHLNELIRRPTSRSVTKIELCIPRSAGDGMVRYELRLRKNSAKFSGEIGSPETLSNEIGLATDLNDSPLHLRRRGRLGRVDDDELRFLLAEMAEYVFNSLLRPLYRDAYYLPADRTGVMHSHHVVVSTLVQNAASAGLRPTVNTPLLSGVLADFLSELIEMSGRPRQADSSLIDELATRLENNVLKGAVRLERTDTGYPNFTYRPDGWSENLPLMRASSMVSELAPVALYLRHIVRPGEVLVIEEPESHLHPAMQVEFTRQLAAIVRAGIRVIVTTHSEWLLEELANLVRLSKVPETQRMEIAGGDVALDADQVGAWLFTPNARPKGSTVREIALDDSGLYQSGFNDVAAVLHNNWAEISSRIEKD